MTDTDTMRIAVAYKRFADNVPMILDCALLRSVKVGLEPVLFLFNGVHISVPGGYERCRFLLNEPEDIVARHAALQKKRDSLVKGKEEPLRAFG